MSGLKRPTEFLTVQELRSHAEGNVENDRTLHPNLDKPLPFSNPELISPTTCSFRSKFAKPAELPVHDSTCVVGGKSTAWKQALPILASLPSREPAGRFTPDPPTLAKVLSL